uniref:Pseudouridylate synthase 1 homolog n=1 Tax=Panagrellus redivivus TaxID=6233 RepID=A0A7E4VC99_PANRE
MLRSLFKAAINMVKTAGQEGKDVLHKVASGRVEKPTTTATAEGEAAAARAKKPKNRKYALFLAYQGKNYFGMQVQSGMGTHQITIESKLLDAMLATGMINEQQRHKFFDWHFQRAARTDRSVSAVRQVCSFYLPLEESFVDEAPKLLNEKLPADIRVLSLRRTVPSFHAQKKCDYRTYSYTLPTFAFADVESLTNAAFRLTPERLAEVNDVLGLFVGTHNFFNYTSKKQHGDMSCNRYIVSFECGKPFTYTHDIGLKKTEYEFATIYIKGQSFMLHQIRKMIGMTLTILRGFQHKSDLTRSFESQRMDVPRAPGLGLILEKVHYQCYDRQFSKQHATLDDLGPEIESTLSGIRDELIIKEILVTEAITSSMLLWLSDLPKHDFRAIAEDEGDERKSELPMAYAKANEAEKAVKEEEEDEEAAAGDDDGNEEVKTEAEVVQEEEKIAVQA